MRRKGQEGGGNKKKVRFHPQRFRRPPGGDSHRIRAPPPCPSRSGPAASPRPSFPPLSARRHFVASAPLPGPAGRPFCEASAGGGGGQRLRGREGQPWPAPPFVSPNPLLHPYFLSSLQEFFFFVTKHFVLNSPSRALSLQKKTNK